MKLNIQPQTNPTITQPNSTKIHSTQLNSTLPNSIKLNPTQLNPTQFNPTEPNLTQLNTTQLNQTQLNSTQWLSHLSNPTLLRFVCLKESCNVEIFQIFHLVQIVFVITTDTLLIMKIFKTK